MASIRSVSRLELGAKRAAEALAGCRLRHHRASRDPKLPGSPDWVNLSKRTVVFINGCFWHSCPLHGTMPRTNIEFWSRKLQRNRERDASTLAYYARLGWRVFVLWEHDLRRRAT